MALTRGWPIHELRTRRHALLIGIPAGLGGVALVVTGIFVGMTLERRRAAANKSFRQRMRRIARR